MRESRTRHSSRNGTVESGDSGHGHLLWSILLGAGMPSGHHVGLQQRALQVHMMVIQGLVHSSQDLKDKKAKQMKPKASLRVTCPWHFYAAGMQNEGILICGLAKASQPAPRPHQGNVLQTTATKHRQAGLYPPPLL